MRILIADDDLGTRETLRELFSPPHTVIEATTAIFATEFLKRKGEDRPDFAVIDGNMPIWAGCPKEETGPVLMELARDQKIPAVLFSGDWEMVAAARRNGDKALMKGDSGLAQEFLKMLEAVGVRG
jgi:CheY-like chemotaxis protein